MKINYKTRKAVDLNVAGNFIVSLISGGTRTAGQTYQVIRCPKTQKIEEDKMWYISDKGFPVSVGRTKFNTFKQKT